MKILREIYDFITGGSIAAPIGLAVAIAVAVLVPGLAPDARAALFLGIVVLTLAAASRERVT